MKILAIGSLFVLFAIVAGINAAPAFADHGKATVDMPEGTGVPGCEVDNTCFVPYEVTVDVGGEVTWTNSDTTIHFVSTGDLSTDPNMVGTDYPNGFDSGIVNLGTEFSHKFEEAGTYPYFCGVHPWMKGIVYVEATGGDKMDGMMQPKSIDDIMATITSEDAMQNSPLSIDVAITDLKGGALEHVNFKITASQGDKVILEESVHTHDGMATTMTAPVPMEVSEDMPVNITVELEGFGVDEVTGPSGQLATKQVVPEFGTIAMMILGISIISIIAITAKSRVIPRI